MSVTQRLLTTLRNNSFIWWLLLASFIPLLVALTLVDTISEKALAEEITDKLSAMADQKISAIESRLRESEKIAVLVSESPVIKKILMRRSKIKKTSGAEKEKLENDQAEDLKALTRFSKTTLDLYGYTDIFVFTKTDEPIFSLNFQQLVTRYQGKLVDKELGRISGDETPDGDIYRELDRVLDRSKTLLAPQLSELIYTDQYFKPQMYIATPVIEKGYVLGSLVLQMSNDFIETPIHDYSGLGNTGETILGFNRANTIEPVVDTRFATILEIMASERNMDDTMKKIFLDASEGTKGRGTMRDYRSKEVLAVAHYVPSLNWGLLLKIDKDEAFQSITALKREIILLGLGTMLGALLLAFLISDQLQKAKNKLTSLMGELETANVAVKNADKAKSQFLSNMSHELRTPLNAVIGYSEMLGEEVQDQGLLELLPDLQKINSAGRHLLSLINDILDITKIEVGKMELYVSDFDVNRLLTDIEAIALPLAAKKGNKLFIQCPPNIGFIQTDETKLRQSLLNLIGNACKFTERGTVTLRVQKYTDKNEPWISFEVIDTGVGISPENLKRLFQAFVQVNSSLMQGGTGLGLYLSQQFSRLMGGNISVKSVVDQGSTFTIAIPTGKKEISSESEPKKVVRKGDKQRILIIDDSLEAQDQLLSSLKKSDFTIIQAFSGENGLQLAREHLPDIIILDIVLPGIDGWQVLARLKADDQTKEIPVIMQSKISPEKFAYSRGVADYLVKPITGNALVANIKKNMSSKKINYILVVDDDENIRDIFMTALQRAGWRVVAVVNGKEALEKIGEEIPSLILLDIMMPVLNGFETIEALQQNENWAKIPVIVLTAATLSEEELNRLRELSLQVFQKSSYRKGDLLDQIKSLLD